jgi:hypothetical protein
MGLDLKTDSSKKVNLNDPVTAGKGTVKVLEKQLIVVLAIGEVVELYMLISLGVTRIQPFRTP